MGRFIAVMAAVLVGWGALAAAQTTTPAEPAPAQTTTPAAPAAPAAPATPAIDPARVTLAREVVNAVGASSLFMDMVRTSRGDFERTVIASGQYDAAAARRMWELYIEEVQVGLPAFLEEIAQTYAKEFTLEQLRDLKRFWESPTGRVVASKQLSLVMAGQRAGAALGVRAGLGAEQRYQQEQDRARNRT